MDNGPFYFCTFHTHSIQHKETHSTKYENARGRDIRPTVGKKNINRRYMTGCRITANRLNWFCVLFLYALCRVEREKGKGKSSNLITLQNFHLVPRNYAHISAIVDAPSCKCAERSLCLSKVATLKREHSSSC